MQRTDCGYRQPFICASWDLAMTRGCFLCCLLSLLWTPLIHFANTFAPIGYPLQMVWKQAHCPFPGNESKMVVQLSQLKLLHDLGKDGMLLIVQLCSRLKQAETEMNTIFGTNFYNRKSLFFFLSGPWKDVQNRTPWGWAPVEQQLRWSASVFGAPECSGHNLKCIKNDKRHMMSSHCVMSISIDLEVKSFQLERTSPRQLSAIICCKLISQIDTCQSSYFWGEKNKVQSWR